MHTRLTQVAQKRHALAQGEQPAIERPRPKLEVGLGDLPTWLQRPIRWLGGLFDSQATTTAVRQSQNVISILARHKTSVAAVMLGFCFLQPIEASPRGLVFTPRGDAVIEANTRAPQHVVKAGESLWSIARDHHTTQDAIKALNPELLIEPRLYPGQLILLPSNVHIVPAGSERGRVVPTPAPPTPAAQPTGDATLQPVLARGDGGPLVSWLETRLSGLHYTIGAPDGVFDKKLRRAVRAFQLQNRLTADGVVGTSTWEKLLAADAVGLSAPDASQPALERYAPGSAEMVTLFREAARRAGVPEDWATSSALRHLLSHESDGWVGRPNYTYGDRYEDHARWSEVRDELREGTISADSSATGLGQLLLDNVDEYYPSGRLGIGDPLEEAIGMLSYIDERYGSPQRAWRLYNRLHEGY